MGSPFKRVKSELIKQIKATLFERYQHCIWCGKTLTLETATVDHLTPQYKGGPTELYNCALACQPCNNLRGEIHNVLRDLKRFQFSLRSRNVRENLLRNNINGYRQKERKLIRRLKYAFVDSERFP